MKAIHSMSKPIIAVDIDDALADSIEAVRLVVNRHVGVDLQSEHYRARGEYWRYLKSVWARHNIDEKVNREVIAPQMSMDQTHIQPHKNGLLMLHKLVKKYELIVVSARTLDWEEATYAWIELYFPHVFSKIVLAGGHEAIRQKSKGQLCVENGALWLIDDNTEHASAALENGVNVILLGDYGWQTPDEIHADAVRCKKLARSWSVF